MYGFFLHCDRGWLQCKRRKGGGGQSHSGSIFLILHVPGGSYGLSIKIRFPDANRDEREAPTQTPESRRV